METKPAVDAATLVALRPPKLTLSRVTRIFELSGFDPLSEDGRRLLGAKSAAAMMQICYALLSPELSAKGVTRDQYLDAFESLEHLQPVFVDAMKVIGNFFLSHAPVESRAAVAEALKVLETSPAAGGVGATFTALPRSRESRLADATQFES